MRLLATCCAVLVLTTLLSGPTTRAARPDTTANPDTTAAVQTSARSAEGAANHPGTTAASTYVAPLPHPLSLHRAFEPPPQPWAAGHRGVDLLADVGAAVRSPAAGTVSFAGDVAGRGVVTIVHPEGLRSSVEPVKTEVDVGTVVVGGELVGVIEARASHCAPSSCLHWGVRDAHGYVDPLLLLRGGPTVLLPGP